MIRLVSLLVVMVALTTAVAAQSTVPDFSGKWTLNSGRNPGELASLKIAQNSSAIEVTEVYKPQVKKVDRMLVYYSDGRGELNPTSDGNSELKSRTRWEGDTLLTLFNLAKVPGTINERRDEWTLSKDGETLTIKSIFSTDGSQELRSPLLTRSGLPPRDNLYPRVFSTTLKRVFKKVK